MSTTQSREEKKKQFLQEYTKRYTHLIPEYLRDNDSFLVFFALLCNEFNTTLDNIRSFTDLINPDKAPKKFLEYLGAYFNYHYQDRAPESFNRELLMRNRKLYEDRGTENSIIMAASHGDNEGYLGGDIFIPGYEISKELAELTVARDRIFIHSKSKLSSTSVYSDADRFRPGVLILSLSYLDANIRNKLWEVIPAGIRLRYNLISDFKPNNPDPIDLYNFITEIGAPKSEFGTLTWYPYQRVVPIFEHGDVNPTDLNYYEPYRNNYPEDMHIFTDLAINRGQLWDILVHSDETLNKKEMFDSDGNFIGDFGSVRLHHGRRLHSGVKLVDDFTDYSPSIGVSALPLSIIRKPFELSSIPENAPYTEESEIIIIKDGQWVTHEIVKVTEERESFKFSAASKGSDGSRHSGGSENVVIHKEDGTEKIITTKAKGQVFGGTYEEIEKEYEQEYIEPEEQVIPKRHYNYYRITPTGEYEDRIDKLTTDSIMRGFNTTLDLEKGYPYKRHNARIHSSKNGRHSGTVYNKNYWRVLHTILISGIDDDIYRISWLSLLNNHYARDRLVALTNEILNKIYNSNYGESQEHTILYVVSMIKDCEDSIEEQIEIYNNSRKGSIERQDAEERIEYEKGELHKYLNELEELKNEIEGELIVEYDCVCKFCRARGCKNCKHRHNKKPLRSYRDGGLLNEIKYILSDGLSPSEEDYEEKAERNKYLLDEFTKDFSWYYPQNPIFSGIFIPGDVNEYISIQTMQPYDDHYPISEVLDYRADYNRPWDREKWVENETEEPEDNFGLNQYGENRNPFFPFNFERERLYEPNLIDFEMKVHGLDFLLDGDRNIIKDANKTLIHSTSGDVRSGKFLLEILHDREDGRGTVHVDKLKIIHSGKTLFSGTLRSLADGNVPECAKLSGEAVYGGLSKEELDRRYITEMYFRGEIGTSSIDLIKEYFIEDTFSVDADVEPEAYDGKGSIFSIIHSSLRGQLSGKSIYSGKQGQSKRTSPEFSFTHSAFEDGKHSGRAWFSGKSNWMNEDIVDATYFSEIGDIEITSEILKVLSDSFSVDIEVNTVSVPHKALVFSSITSIIGHKKGMYRSGAVDEIYYKEPAPDSFVHSTSRAIFSGKYSFEGGTLYPNEPLVYAVPPDPKLDIDKIVNIESISSNVTVDVDDEIWIVPWNSMIHSSNEHKFSSYRMFSGEWIYKSDPIVDAKGSADISKDVNLEIESDSYDVEADTLVIRDLFLNRAINFSYSMAKFSGRKALHSGYTKRPSPGSMVHSAHSKLSDAYVFDGSVEYPEENIIDATANEPTSEIVVNGDLDKIVSNVNVNAYYDTWEVSYNSMKFSHDGYRHNSYKMFSGEWIYQKEPIVDCKATVNLDKSLVAEIEFESYNTSVEVDVIHTSYSTKAINFSYSDAKFSTRLAMHSGKTPRPSLNSLRHSANAIFSGREIYEGSEVYQEEPIVEMFASEPSIDKSINSDLSKAIYDGVTVDMEDIIWKIPHMSIIHSSNEHKFSSYKMFSGEWVYKSDQIVKSDVNADMSLDKTSEINTESYSVGVEVATEMSIFNNKAINLSYSGAKFSMHNALHSGELEGPSKDSIIHSSINSKFSGRKVYEGLEMYSKEPLVEWRAEEPTLTYSIDKDGKMIYNGVNIIFDTESWKAPYESMIFSSQEHKHCSYKMMSGDWVYRNELIVDAKGSVNTAKDINIDLLKNSDYDVTASVNINQESYNENSLNFSSKDTKLSSSSALHSGDKEKPSKDSIAFGKSGAMSGTLLHDGKVLNQ